MGTSRRAVHHCRGLSNLFISEKSRLKLTTMGKGDNGGFSQEQLDMYRECFKLMDIDKDGTLGKSDLRAAFDNVGKLMDESELDAMLGEVGGACNFDNMVKMFQEKMAGGSNGPDDLIVRAFKAYEVEGKIEAEMFRHALMNFGDKFNKAEVDDIFGEFEVDDDGFIASKDVNDSLLPVAVRRRRKRRRPPSKLCPIIYGSMHLPKLTSTKSILSDFCKLFKREKRLLT